MKISGTGRLFAYLLSAALLLQGAAGAYAEAFPFTANTSDSVRLRKAPSAGAEVLLTVPAGEALIVTGADGDFYAVLYEGAAGFVMKPFVAVPAQALDAGSEQPVPSAYSTLSAGDSGAGVKALQQALSELAFYKGGVDAKFGAMTAEAVRAFQERNGLPASGAADPAMQELLYEGVPKNADGKTTDVRTLSPLPGVTLRPGDRGDAVGALQRRLKELGYFNETVDDEYGTATVAAVRDFQKENGLKTDGVAGAQTQEALFSPTAPVKGASPALAADPTPSPAPAKVSGSPYPYRATASAPVNLRRTASLSSMRILTVPKGASVNVLGESGDYLKVSYGKYTGYVMTVYVNVPAEYLPGSTLAPDPAAQLNYRTLSAGSSGNEVRVLQLALSELGFHSGAADGVFGGGTLVSVKAFQKRNGLRETGAATPEMQKRLYEEKCRNSKNRLVYVKTLPPVDGFPMEAGDRGDAVRQLHEALQTLGLYSGRLTDEYSAATAAAVKAFQKEHSIKQTGKADAFTQLAITTALSAQQGAEDTPAPGAVNGADMVTIRLGMRGQQVYHLQERLVQLGYYSIDPDSFYDGNDVSAVREFQKINGLIVDGIAGPATQLALYSGTAVAASGATLAPARTPAPTAAPAAQTSLRIGMSGNAVKAMQTRLIALRYLSGAADGIFGTRTAEAVAAFQKNHRLTPDGIAGALTLASLYSAEALPQTTPAPAPSSVPEAAKTVLKIGDRGEAVKAMQQRLLQLRYLSGPADGIFGPATFLAVKSFQSKNSLSADGVAGPLTLAKLNSASAVTASGVPAGPATPTPVPAPAGFSAPAAGEVRFAQWYAEVRARARSLPNVIVYDFISGSHWSVRIFSIGAHADGEPVSKADTQAMNAALGENNWTPRPVWVVFSDGRVYMASTHSRGHEVDHNAQNGLSGHICIHFPREMEEAARTGPYAVSHQNAILAGWDLTKNLAR